MIDAELAVELQHAINSPVFRVYVNADVLGVELCAAAKNVIALAAGGADGLELGDNAKAALVARGLAEMARLAEGAGGKQGTFAGLAGMGDLIATCTSVQSRNFRVGIGLAQGRKLDEIVDEMKMVAEGVKTTRAVLDLAERAGVEMPIASQVARVLYEGHHPREAVMSLMTRQAKSES